MFDATEICCGKTVEELLHSESFGVQTKMPVNSTPLIEIAASEAKMVVRTLRIVSFL